MCKYNRYILPILSLLLWVNTISAAAKTEEKYLSDSWVNPMSQVHQKFQGVKGTFAHFGDSITVTMAFWTPLLYERRNTPPEMESAYSLVKGYMQNPCWREWKGPQYGSQGSMTIRWAHQHIDDWLAGLNPEVALIMFGTNDLNSVPLSEYRQKLRDVIQKCLDNGTVVILSTIPPRHRMADKAAQYSESIREIAREMQVPLTDFHQEILQRRLEDWDGALEKFSAYQGYDVPTLIARDGVHPSHPKAYQNDYSDKALRCCGFSLRNYLTLLQYAQVIEKVLQTPRKKKGESYTIFLENFEREGDWLGKRSEKNVPPTNRYALQAKLDNNKSVKLQVRLKPKPVLAFENMFLSFEYYLQHAAAFDILLGNDTQKEVYTYRREKAVQEKWNRLRLNVTNTFRVKNQSRKIMRNDQINELTISAVKSQADLPVLLIDNIRLYGDIHEADSTGPAKPEGPLERKIFLEDFEYSGEWDGVRNGVNTYQSNGYVLEGLGGDKYFGRKIRVGIRRPPLAIPANTCLIFDYYLEGSDFLQVFLFDLDLNDNCRYRIDQPVLGKWTRQKIWVNNARLQPGHKVDDIFFFAGEPANPKTRLRIDNVRLYVEPR
jgi:GDSL-like lipase/acylhydrolase family protein